jgi:hypothetical protein
MRYSCEPAARGAKAMKADFISIHDDMYGEGTDLAFPTMSSCCAIIAVLNNRLVGVHKTQDLSPGGVWGRAQSNSRYTKTHAKILEDAAALIKGGGGASELYVAGWGVTEAGGSHDVTDIQNALGCATVPTFIYNYADSFTPNRSGIGVTAYTHFGGGHKKANDVCTFAFHRGKQSPRIAVKRTTKVAIVTPNSGNTGGKALVETLETPSDHLHDVKKFIQFSRFRV